MQHRAISAIHNGIPACTLIPCGVYRSPANNWFSDCVLLMMVVGLLTTFLQDITATTAAQHASSSESIILFIKNLCFVFY
jgi:hypothetical protein